jgi:hypothetical protein
MADRIERDITAAASRTASSASSKAALSRRSTEPDTVFVELGQITKSAQIVREGVGVPVLEMNADLLRQVLAGTPRVQAKVVTQSIPAGVSVSPGSTIDVVLAEPERLPASIIQDAHVVLGERTIGEVHEQFIRNNENLRRVVARNASAEALTDADRGVITAALEQGNVEVSNDPGKTVENAFSVLQAAFTFG